MALIIFAVVVSFNEDVACYCGFHRTTTLRATKLGTQPSLVYRLSFKTPRRADYMKVYGRDKQVLHEGPISAEANSNHNVDLSADNRSGGQPGHFDRVELYRGGVLRAVAKNKSR